MARLIKKSWIDSNVQALIFQVQTMTMFVPMFSSSQIFAKISPKFTPKKFKSQNLSYLFNVNLGEVLALIYDEENINTNTVPRSVLSC